MRGRAIHRTLQIGCAVVMALGLAGAAWAVGTPAPCSLPDHPTVPGTVQLPPAGCPYIGPTEFHALLTTVPPGSTLIIDPIHSARCGPSCESPTPNPSTSTTETFNSSLDFNVTGTGTLSAVNCTLSIPTVPVTTVTQPRDVGIGTQTFDTEMVSLSATLPLPDSSCNLFSSLVIKAGTGQGLASPSPGRTTLFRTGAGTWNVDSFFDVFYEISYVGKPGGPLDGFSGTETGTLRMQSGVPGPVPTLSPWGAAGLALLLVGAALFLMIRRRVSRRAAAAV